MNDFSKKKKKKKVEGVVFDHFFFLHFQCTYYPGCVVRLSVYRKKCQKITKNQSKSDSQKYSDPYP